jgi:hypothetical protein
MNTFVENNKEKFCSLIFSTVYLVKSLRNTNINTIEYTKQVDYLDKQSKNKIYSNNEIVYVKNLDKKSQNPYSTNQKWRITQFYDYEGEIIYEIEPYFENNIITNNNNNKILITPDNILSSLEEEKIVENIDTFREKYENSFLLYVIYFCFYNCVTIINKTNVKIINLFLNNQVLFDKLMKKIIDMNKNSFTNLDFEIDIVLPSINNIIKNIQINILKIFNIQSYESICDLNKSKELQDAVVSNILNFTTNYKIQFVKRENYKSNKLNSDLYVFYDSYNKLSIPEIPANIKINYITPYGNNNNIRNSNIINLFNIFCKTFNINSDAMLSVLKYNYNATTNSIINYNKSNLELKSGLTQQNLVKNEAKLQEKVTVSTGGKKSKHNCSKKIYKGGVWPVAALLLAGKSMTAYVAISDVAAAIAAGWAVIPGGGGLIAGGGGAVLMASPVAGVVGVGVAGAASPVWVPIAMGGAAVLAGGYGVYNYLSPNVAEDIMGETKPIINDAEIKEEIRQENRNKQIEGQKLADAKALIPQPGQQARIADREEKQKERSAAKIEEEAKIVKEVVQEAKAAEKKAIRQENRNQQIEGQKLADAKALIPQPGQEKLIEKRERKQKKKMDAKMVKEAENRNQQIEGQKLADAKALIPQPGQEKFITEREEKQEKRTAANVFKFNNPAYNPTIQTPEIGTSANPHWPYNNNLYDSTYKDSTYKLTDYGLETGTNQNLGLSYDPTIQPPKIGTSANPDWPYNNNLYDSTYKDSTYKLTDYGLETGTNQNLGLSYDPTIQPPKIGTSANPDWSYYNNLYDSTYKDSTYKLTDYGLETGTNQNLGLSYDPTIQPPKIGTSANPDWSYYNNLYDSTYKDSTNKLTDYGLETGTNQNLGLSYDPTIQPPKIGTSANPDWSYYSTNQPKGVPQLNTNNDFNNYNKFLPAGEKQTMPQQDFTDLSTVFSLGVFAIAGICIAKKMGNRSHSEQKKPKANKQSPSEQKKPKANKQSPLDEKKTKENIDLYTEQKKQSPLDEKKTKENIDLYSHIKSTTYNVSQQHKEPSRGGKTRKRKIKRKKSIKKRKYNLHP